MKQAGQRKSFKRETAMAKLYSSEIAVTNAREATQLHGGHCFMNGLPVVRTWRDSKILEIGEGTSEVHRILIARDLACDWLTVRAGTYSVGVADYCLVRLARGAAWDHSRPRREQAGWDEHAAVMDSLVEAGVVILGGPVGEGDGEDSLLLVDAEQESAIRDLLAADPWVDELLTITSVEPWSIWLRGTTQDNLR